MPNTAFFQPDLFQFLRQLKRHNNREWFARNKARYQQLVVEPAMHFISAFAPHLAKLSPHFVADARPTAGLAVPHLPRHAILLRQDSLQNAYRNSLLARGRQGRPRATVFYLHLEPDGCFVAAGVWHPDNRALTKIRTAIVGSRSSGRR